LCFQAEEDDSFSTICPQRFLLVGYPKTPKRNVTAMSSSFHCLSSQQGLRVAPLPHACTVADQQRRAINSDELLYDALAADNDVNFHCTSMPFCLASSDRRAQPARSAAPVADSFHDATSFHWCVRKPNGRVGSVKIATVALTIAGLSARFGKGDGLSRLPSLFAALFSSPSREHPLVATQPVSGVLTRASCCARYRRDARDMGPIVLQRARPAAAASDDFAVARFDARECRTLRMGL